MISIWAATAVSPVCEPCTSCWCRVLPGWRRFSWVATIAVGTAYSRTKVGNSQSSKTKSRHLLANGFAALLLLPGVMAGAVGKGSTSFTEGRMV